MSNIIIRQATSEDVALILQLIKELATYEKLLHEVITTHDDLKNSLFGADAVAKVVIAELDDQPVGFALYFYNYSTFLGKTGLYLEDLYVREEARGKGIGKMLLKYLAQIAIEKGCGRFEWWVLDWNEPALEFYRSIGAVAMDEWTVQRVTGDALIALANS